MLFVKIHVVLIICLANSVQVFSNQLNERTESIAKLLQDVIENEKVPSILWATICWSKRDEISLLRAISIPIQIASLSNPISLSIDENTNKQWFFVDMSCRGSSSFLSSVEDKYFAHPYRWIIADATNHSIENLTFLPDSNIILANEEENSKRYTLKQAYKIAKENALIYEDFGRWSYEEGLVDQRTTGILSRRRRDLHGHQLKVAAAFAQEGSEKHLDLDDYRHNNLETLAKLSLEISKYWIKSLNSTIKIDIQRTQGYTDPITGEITGVLGLLQRKEADASASVVFMTANRIDFLEYLSVVLKTNFAFVMRAPPISYVSNIYALPFTPIAWICSIALIILCTIVVAKTQSICSDRFERTDRLNLSDYLLFAIASVCQKSSEIPTKFMSTRIAMYFFFLVLLYIYISYTANIVALLQSTTKSIRTVSDLQNPDIGIGVDDTPYHRYLFPLATEPSRRQLFETKIEPPNGPYAYMNISEGIARVRQGMFAFHATVDEAYYEIKRTFYQHEKCGLIEIKFLSMGDVWWVIQKHSPYKEILKVNIMKVNEHGIQTRERYRFHNLRPKCESDGQFFDSVFLYECSSIFYIIFIGYAASLIILCVEKLLHKFSR